MPRRVVWTAAALRDLKAILSYLGQFNPQAAARLAERIVASGESLVTYPERGRSTEGARRELLTVWPYLIGYRVRGDRVEIVRVRHGARLPWDTPV